ncbi:hypothetical protein H5410_043570 [Solanum commersonii]|uniref:Uncharacterized protein n=1 Tax=Solanum commersonii TaxID=4109 RepID=A0A9J5Y0M0_SOLCO|nr:hypothetical protein H5410_043570 [Solanum commersonii]
MCLSLPYGSGENALGQEKGASVEKNYQDLLLVIQAKIQHPTPRGEFSLTSAASKIGLWIAINLYGVIYFGLVAASFEIYHLFMKTWVCFEMVSTQTSSDSVQ